MADKEQIISFYINAREQVKLKNPRLARKYVLMILNSAVKSYYSEGTGILAKAKLAAFMDKWLAVSRDLYDVGITEYVNECFGLAKADKKDVRRPAGKAAKGEGAAVPAASGAGAAARKKTAPQKPPVGNKPPVEGAEIDISGLIDETEAQQGWGAEIFDANRTAVVQISAMGVGSISSGTGFIISDKGYLLTNDHVVFDEQNGVYHTKLKMSLAGEKKAHKIEVVISDKNADVALCRFTPSEVEGFTVVKPIRDYSVLKQGADCLVIGNAFGMGLAPCMGIIRFTKNDNGNLVYTIPSNPGDSGGPVFNRAGECIGINKSKTVAVNGTAAEGYANATPMDTIQQLLQKWCKTNDITL